MKAVVDTNVVAYYLLGTEPFIEEVRQFWHTIEEACAPTHWEAELANTIWIGSDGRPAHRGRTPETRPGGAPQSRVGCKSIAVATRVDPSTEFRGRSLRHPVR